MQSDPGRPALPARTARDRRLSAAGGDDGRALPLLVHRDPRLYPDPWRFDPSRFLDRRPVASEWFPFGGAVRRCVGAAFAQFEARIVLQELFGALRLAPTASVPSASVAAARSSSQPAAPASSPPVAD